MKKGLSIVGVILLFLGVLWTLQGIGFVGGSFMSGQTRWTVIGLVTMVAGFFVIVWARRSRFGAS